METKPDGVAKAKRKRESVGEAGGISTYQKFAVVRIRRSRISNATYNPRIISDDARDRLRSAIAKQGLVMPIVWNERTGNIVGGHQRISVLDDLEGGRDYDLDVARIDVDVPAEKELNILLNNPETQGDWDMEKLNALLRDPEVGLDNTGFNAADVMQLFGESAVAQKDEALDTLAESLQQARDRYEKIVAGFKDDRDSDDFYAVLVFRNPEERKKFTDALGVGDNRYVDGRKVMESLAKPETKAQE